MTKIGFTSAKAIETAEVRLHELAIPGDEIVDLDSLKRAGIVHQQAKRAKVIASGAIAKAVTVRGLALSKSDPAIPTVYADAADSAHLASDS